MSHPDLWQKLQSLKPALPRHIEFQRRDYAREVWYILHDKSNGRFHRLSPSAYLLLTLMDGHRTLDNILQAAAAPGLYPDAQEIPTEAEIIQLLQYLHVADLLVCDLPPNTQELFARQQKKHQQFWLRLITNPLTWKFTLGNPDKFLTACMPLARLIATPVMGMIWLSVIIYALIQAGNHWAELTHGQLHKILSPGNLFLLWLIYPLLKIFHELGHGLFTKVWGGHVHEWGVVFVVGTPLPYVDASASIAFSSKLRRLMVGAAGMAVELFFAALALLLWLNVQDGLVRDILYNIIIIGGVSTLFFNGNPLMRYDGYHLLTEAFDWPNLAARANRQMHYLVRRFGYGEDNAVTPATTNRQGAFFAIYGIAAFIYRLGMLFTIILLVANHFPALGLLLAIWLIFFQLLLPSSKYFYSLFTQKITEKNARRVLGFTVGIPALLVLFLCVVPLPMSTYAEGLLWLPETARLKAESSGEVTQVFVEDNTRVEKNQPLVQLSNPKLLADLTLKQATLREYEARYQQVWLDNRIQAEVFAQDISAVQTEIELLQKRVEHLTIRSANAGVFRKVETHELLGSYIQQGESVGVVLADEPTRVRAALTQEEIGLVRTQTRAVEIKFAATPSQVLAAHISQQVPAATYELPSAVLGAQGGGRLAIDASHSDGTKTAQMVFLVDVALDGIQQHGLFGERVYIRFYHPAEPAAVQVYRLLQQLFIRSFQY